MKNVLIAFFLIFISGCNPKNENHKTVSMEDMELASSAFLELQVSLKKENGKLWNLNLEGPLLLIDRNTRTIIANEADKQGALIKQGDFYVGSFPEDMNISNTAVDWNGKRWTMLALPLPENKKERMSLLIHESFHRIQPLLGFDSLMEIPGVHLDSKRGRIYMKLELEAIKSALSSEEPLIYIKDALLFRQYRQQLFQEAKQTENALEINEGIAEYTGSILAGWSEMELKNHYKTNIERLYTIPSFVRSFAYVTIPVYGFFMQQSIPTWNLSLNKKTNLTDYIINFYDLNPRPIDSLEIHQIGQAYNIDSTIKFENIREENKLKQIKIYKDRFLGEGAVSIPLENMRIGFNPSNIIPLESYGTVYPNLRITDNWGILKVDSCGALVSSQWNKVTLSEPQIISDTLIAGRGWKLHLKSDWKLSKKNNKYQIIKE